MGEITDAFVKQFADNFYVRAQQKKSRLEDCVRHEDGIVGISKTVDRIAPTTAKKRTTRNGDTPIIKTQFDRRVLVLSDYEWADLLDDQDKIKMLIDPTSDTLGMGVAAMKRATDDEIIAALGGNSLAQSGEGAAAVYTNIALPAGQKIAAGAASLTIAKLLTALEIMGGAEAFNEDDENDERYVVLTQKQVNALLNTTEVKSSDYNTVKALAEGKIDTFMGFKFRRIERLIKSGNDRLCYAWVKRGVARGVGQDIVTKVSERSDKSYAVQPYAKMSIGAVRVEEECVVEIACTE